MHEEIKSQLLDIQESFPNGIDYSFGYGSGVFPQVSSNPPLSNLKGNQEPMVDLIFAVSDPSVWHEENLRLHKDHYAFLPNVLGNKFICWIQEMGAGVYFNPMVKMNCRSMQSLLKYGVISTSTLKSDLKEWDTLYIAGRMQKPTSIISAKDDEILEIQEKYNLRYALSAALLLIPATEQKSDFKCPTSKIFESVTELSYIGDPRIKAGAEDPHKISKIVHSPGQFQRFQSMYTHEFSCLESMGLLSVGNNGQHIEINFQDPSIRKELGSRLPSKFHNQKIKSNNFSVSSIRRSIGNIVSRPAQIQSAKGVLMAGVYKSILYAGAKVAKGLLSRR